ARSGRGGGGGAEREKSSEGGGTLSLIKLLGDFPPADIAHRAKRGFTIPYKHWLETSFQPLIEETCSRKAMAERGLLDPDLSSKLAGDESAQRWTSWPFAWSLMILELWCRAMLDG